MKRIGFKNCWKWIICAAVLTAMLCFAIVFHKSPNYKKVKAGISLTDAIAMVENDPQCFIVMENGGAGIEFEIAYGEYSGTDVNLIGHPPQDELSNIFFKNTFLVKGTERNIEKRGLDWMETYPDMYSIDVTSWEIVTPIQRDYTYRDVGQKSRWFAPSDYIDSFDVEQGDYVEK